MLIIGNKIPYLYSLHCYQQLLKKNEKTMFSDDECVNQIRMRKIKSASKHDANRVPFSCKVYFSMRSTVTDRGACFGALTKSHI